MIHLLLGIAMLCLSRTFIAVETLITKTLLQLCVNLISEDSLKSQLAADDILCLITFNSLVCHPLPI